MFAQNAAETFVTWSLAASFVSMVIKTYFEYFAASEGRNKFVHRIASNSGMKTNHVTNSQSMNSKK